MSRRIGRMIAALAMAASALAVPVAAHAAGANDIESAFDRTFSQEQRNSRPVYHDPFQAHIAHLASGEQGRIGVAAFDLSTGKSMAILGDQPFPMASTSKVAIAATFLEMVDAGRYRLTDQFPLMVPVASRKFAGPVAPVRAGTYYSAQYLIELSLTRSSNPATDALLAAVGGPRAVNDWMRRAGIEGARIDRDIATLVRDDGAVNPATTIDPRDSATPKAMVNLLAGLYQGRWLSPQSRAFLLDTMARCETGKRRIRGPHARRPGHRAQDRHPVQHCERYRHHQHARRSRDRLGDLCDRAGRQALSRCADRIDCPGHLR